MPVRVVNNISQEYGGILTASRKLSRKLSVTLKEEKGLEVTVDKDPNLMHISVTIASTEGLTFKVTANSTVMALSKCYAGFLTKGK